MTERFKYGKHGVYRCENVAQHLAENSFPKVPIGTVRGVYGWYITLRIENDGDSVYLYPFMHSHVIESMIKVRWYFRLVSKDGVSLFEKHKSRVIEKKFGLAGYGKSVQELLDKTNGYLDDGALIFETSIHPLLSKLLEKCLQIAHGVRVHLGGYEYFTVILFARKLKLFNVVHYCEQHCIRKKNGTLCFINHGSSITREGYGMKGCDMKIQSLLDDKNGYLDNGTLIVECGVHVEGILYNNIWRFNLFYEFFEWKEMQNMVTCKYQNCITGRETEFYGQKQLLTFHSSNYIDTIHKVWVNHGTTHELGWCLQIAHGVQIQIKDGQHIEIIIVAQDLKLFNVIHYCEQHFLRLHHNSSRNVLRDAILLNLRHILAHSLKEIESLEMLVSEVKEMDIDEMPGESMKMIAAKIFDRKY
ncbi:unnamed protein product [Caenorhabditis brenneri]